MQVLEKWKANQVLWKGGTGSLGLNDRVLSVTGQGGEKTDSQKQNTGSSNPTIPVSIFKTVV